MSEYGTVGRTVGNARVSSPAHRDERPFVLGGGTDTFLLMGRFIPFAACRKPLFANRANGRSHLRTAVVGFILIYYFKIFILKSQTNFYSHITLYGSKSCVVLSFCNLKYRESQVWSNPKYQVLCDYKYLFYGFRFTQH